MLDDARCTELYEIVLNLDVRINTLYDFLNRIKQGGVVNIHELSKPVNHLTNIFDQDPTSIQLFNALKTFGTGSYQLGPGEMALAYMSNQIRLSYGQGDIEIDGIGCVEVKTALNTSGGRLGYMSAPQSAQMKTLRKYREIVPSIYAKVMENRGGSLGIIPFVKLMCDDLPLPDKKQERWNLIRDITEPNFDKYSYNIANAFASQDNPENLMLEYVKQNFEWYKDKEKFDAYLVLGVGRNKTMMGRTGEEIVHMYKNGHLNGFSISMIPSRAGSREGLAQIKLSATEP